MPAEGIIDWSNPDTIDAVAHAVVRFRREGNANASLAGIVLPGVLERVLEIEQQSSDAADYGRAPEDILERESGGLITVATLLYDIGSNLEHAVAEFGHDYVQDPVERELARRCQDLLDHLRFITVRENGTLSLNLECGRCGGDGSYRGIKPPPEGWTGTSTPVLLVCEDCQGRGYVPAEAAP